MVAAFHPEREEGEGGEPGGREVGRRVAVARRYRKVHYGALGSSLFPFLIPGAIMRRMQSFPTKNGTNWCEIRKSVRPGKLPLVSPGSGPRAAPP